MADLPQRKELQAVLSKIEKDMGKGTIMSLADSQAMQDVQGISAGALSIDIALGGRGFPRGRIIEIYGPESSGKTTLALHAIANAQKTGGVAAFIDAEHALDPGWARRIGVDLGALLVSQPSSGEEALKVAEMLVKSNAVDLIVIDSVAALVPKAELDGDIGDTHVGLQARLMSQAMRILNPAIAKTQTAIIFINQLRSKVGVIFGSPETTSGGNALKYYASVRVDVRKITTLKDGEDTVGSRMKVKIVKNKVAPPFKVAEVDLMHDRGIAWESDILELAVDDEIVKKSGANYYYGDTKLGLGEMNVKKTLREMPELVEEIKRKVLAGRGINLDAPAVHPTAANPPATEETIPAPTPKRRGKAAAAPDEFAAGE